MTIEGILPYNYRQNQLLFNSQTMDFVNNQRGSNPCGGGYRTLTVPKGHIIANTNNNISVQQSKLNLQTPSDTVCFKASEQIQQTESKKKGLSAGAKWGVGLSSVFGSLALAGILIRKHDTAKLKKLFSEKLVLKELPETLQYKATNNKEQAIKFAKEVLGIKHIDDKMTPEALDWLNTALVNVSNAHKGKVYIPQRVYYVNRSDSATAAVIQDIKSQHFGDLIINKEYFSNENITKKLEKYLGLDKVVDKVKEGVAKTTNSTPKELTLPDLFTIKFDDEMYTLMEKFAKSRDSISFKEKLHLCTAFENTNDLYFSMIEHSPSIFLKNNIKIFKDAGINVNLEEFVKLPIKEQRQSIEKLIFERYNKTKAILKITQDKSSPYGTLYHEMGHLQDFAKNQKEMQIMQAENIDLFKRIKNMFNNKGLKPLDDRWGGTTYEGYKELLESNPDKFKELYPKLYEHLTNKEIQETAGKISEYATTSIGEFIAETYSKFLQGKPMGDDIIALYKKYNGPLLPGM